MKSRPTINPPYKRLHVGITLYFAFMYINCVHAKGHVRIIKLQHAYANLISSKKSGGKGMSKEHMDLFKAHDMARHGRVLANATEFPLGGNFNPYVAGIYFTRISLGTPSKDYYVQVDTGSDLLWLNCNPCTACPRTNNLGMVLVPYDPDSSITSSPLSCEDPVCGNGLKIVNTNCDGENYCGYGFQYGDESSTTGYLIADKFMYNSIQANNSQDNTDANIIFGCGYSQSGNLLSAQNVVDGIMGFGQSKLSVISQLYMQGLIPRVFAHCLQGSEKGGGILVIGNVVDHGFPFTPIISSEKHYNVKMKGISVNGVQMEVKSSAYDTAEITEGTIFDSGTTLAYLVEPLYTSFVTSIIKGAPSEAYQLPQPGNTCFVYSGSVDDAFPAVTLHFDGADMKLKGSHYLIQQEESVNIQVWCIGWHSMDSSSTVSSSNSISTIFGDMVLKDKLVVYDLENQRIGWVDYDCSNPINVSIMNGKSQPVDSDQLKSSASSLKMSPFSLSLILLLSSMKMYLRSHILI